MTQCIHLEVQFTDADVANPDDFIPAGAYNPHNVRPWLIHDQGVVVAVVFASCEQDALDTAVDEGKMDQFQISKSELADWYPDGGEGESDGEGVTHLGNASEPFDISCLTIVELPNPKFSFAALFNASK